MQPFYIYLLCDPRKPGQHVYGGYSLPFEPFYVGKGHGKRAWNHTDIVKRGGKSANPHKDRVIAKLLKLGLTPVVKILKESLTEDDAFKLEKSLISLIGRMNLHTGPLFNLSEGGEGNSGYGWSQEQRDAWARKVSGEGNPYFGRVHSDEARAKMVASHPDNSGKNNPFYGKHHSQESRDLTSAKLKGRGLGVAFTLEHRSKIADSNRGKKKPRSKATNAKVSETLKALHSTKRQYTLTTPTGEEVKTRNLKAWCIEQGINYHMMLYTARGQYSSYQGYTCTIQKVD
jgi:group I intron endonuclease